ncbi:MAG: gliding motility-associated C-terminal domain-containing protein [Edaphocola sp.]
MYKFYVSTLFVIVALATSVRAQNLVLNGSFDASGTNWTYFTPATGTECYTYETSYGGTDGTNHVAEIDASCNLRQANIALTVGTTYVLSFRHSRRTLGGAPNPVACNVIVYDGTTTYINQTISDTNTTWNWQCASYTFTATTATATLDFANVTATTLGTILDDITITPLTQTATVTGQTCQGGTLTISPPYYPNDADNLYEDYLWQLPDNTFSTDTFLTINNAQPTNDGTYTCTMTLNHCASVTVTYNLTVTPANFYRTATICKGEVYNFYGRWLYATGTYDTLVSNGGNTCDSFISLTLTVNPRPNTAISPSGKVGLCDGDALTLTITDPTTGATYQWYKDNAALTGANGSSYTTQLSGSYYIVGSANNCYDTSAKAIVSINSLPVANIVFDGEVLCAADTFTLQAGNAVSTNTYLWEPAAPFRKIGLPEGTQVQGIFNDATTKVILTVLDINGCSAQDTVDVNTQLCCEIFAPNAFSPNGDGTNDYFKPALGIGQNVLKMAVYDRYGHEVYNSAASLGKGWDGNYPNAKPAAAGVYMYQVTYTCADKKIYKEKGDVTLIR